MMTLLQQIPDPKATGDFLLQGGAFALLSLLICGSCIAGWRGAKALYALLREFLGKTSTQLETQTALLGQIHGEQKTARERSEETADMLGQWRSPEWLVKRLDTLETRLEGIKDQIGRLRDDYLASAHKTIP